MISLFSSRCLLPPMTDKTAQPLDRSPLLLSSLAGGVPLPCFASKADKKHVIPGMDKHEPGRREPHPGCDRMGLSHNNGFHDLPPCRDGGGEAPTRESLVSCLWSTSERCVQFMTSVDPAVRR